jgi:poly-gamma-glutamate capsule biosynthesis protein CapA/YwtB (metallophosphatase superfamily)
MWHAAFISVSACAAAALGAGLHAGASSAGSTHDGRGDAGRGHLVHVDTTPPMWLAPGGVANVGGFAGASETLRLVTAHGDVLARTTSGQLGRFVLRFRAPKPGRYRLRIVGESRSTPVGALLVRPLILDAVGDITFGEQVGPALASYGAAYPWTQVAQILRSADITTGNLETSVSERGSAQEKQYTFRGPPHALRPMSTLAGFDVLTLANNHSGDFGRDALLDTVRAVRSAGMQPIGAGANLHSATQPAIIAAGGLKIAFLGFSDINPAGFIATPFAPGTASADLALLSDAVRAARRRADLVVCFLHWGVELVPSPDRRQEQIARACLTAGASVVLGAHPHVLGPVSRPSRRTLVAWTLGNFVFPSTGPTAKTAILQVRLDAHGVSGHRLIPVEIEGFRPRPDFTAGN